MKLLYESSGQDPNSLGIQITSSSKGMFANHATNRITVEMADGKVEMTDD